jgi:hypothetical protein
VRAGERERDRKREREKQTDRNTDRERERERESVCVKGERECCVYLNGEREIEREIE